MDNETILSAARPEIRDILERALAGREMSAQDARRLFDTSGTDLAAVQSTADALRRQKKGDIVTFVAVRNINFTNVCYGGCRFCSYSRPKESRDAEFLTVDEVAARAAEAHARGATEVCIQGGLHPDIPGEHYRDILVAVRSRVPGMHIHAFSAAEIQYGADKMRMDVRDYLRMLKENGLGSMPGTAAEILDERVRKILAPNKISTGEWIRIIRTAHEVGIPTTSTMMYGHIDGPDEWVAHLDVIRSIQKETRGFTEFVPLPFVHPNAPLYRDGLARPGPTREENIKVHAIARIFFNGFIDNIQVSWVKLGPTFAAELLQTSGVNDLGGTLMNENISKSAGATFGEEMSARQLCDLILSIGRIPARRGTLYNMEERYV